MECNFFRFWVYVSEFFDFVLSETVLWICEGWYVQHLCSWWDLDHHPKAAPDRKKHCWVAAWYSAPRFAVQWRTRKRYHTWVLVLPETYNIIWSVLLSRIMNEHGLETHYKLYLQRQIIKVAYGVIECFYIMFLTKTGIVNIK